MQINWKKYVDHIYIVNYTLTNKYYLEHFYKELERVNINRYDIDFVTDFMNINTPMYEKIYNQIIQYKYNDEYDYTFSCSMGHYYCMKHAQNNNYERILIFENDAIFYDDINVIIYLLDNAKYLFDTNQCDLFLGGSGCLEINGDKINYDLICLFQLGDKLSAGTTFNIYNKRGYEVYINLIEHNSYKVIDLYSDIYDVNRVWVSNPIICVQKCWDCIMYNLYEHYNMIKPTEKDIIAAYNTAQELYHGNINERNLYRILNQVLEHYNLVDTYKDIYEECKKHY